ncbi:MAG: hypothetical protein QM758_12430 [Armatimonas sp.]
MKLPSLRVALYGALFALLTTGCAQISGSTEVKPDGAYTRTLVFEGDKPKGPKDQAEMGMGPTIDQLVIVPRTPGWDVKKAYDKSKITITATRSFAAGEASVNDLLVKGDPNKGESVLANTVSVTKRDDGKLEYREVIRWVGPKDNSATETKQIEEELKKNLPAEKAGDTAAIKATATILQKEVVRAILGPGDPLLGLLLTHPHYAEFKLRKHIGGAIRTALTEGFGDKLTEAERDSTAKGMLATLGEKITDSAKPTPPGPPAEAPDGDSGKKQQSPLVAILLKVKLPGKVVETNGELDDLTGEVVWPLYSEAPTAGDITLRAVCEP